MPRNKINDLRNLLFEQIEKMMDPECDLGTEKEKAEVICKLAQVIVMSAKVEVDFFKASGYDAGLGTGFIPLEMPKTDA